MKPFFVGNLVLALILAAVAGATFFLPRVTEGVVPFEGPHQAGIATPPQSFALVAGFDVIGSDRERVRLLLRAWTLAARSLTEKASLETSTVPAEVDTGENIGYRPSRITITVGVGPSLFDSRFGLGARRPDALVDLPVFANDKLEPSQSNGDLGVQFCGDDLASLFGVFHNFVKIAAGTASLRWAHSGFLPTAGISPRHDPRNVQGFHDGTRNVDPTESKQMEQVWAEGSDWMAGGSYLVMRKIRVKMETWDTVPVADKERIVGRTRNEGTLVEKPSSESHVVLAHGDGSSTLFRRGYSFFDGSDAETREIKAGLLFLAWQKDPRQQFIPLQRRLSQLDALNQYTTAQASAVFAMFPGVGQGEYLGQKLFEGL